MWASFVNSYTLKFLNIFVECGVFCEFKYFEIFKFIC